MLRNPIIGAGHRIVDRGHRNIKILGCQLKWIKVSVDVIDVFFFHPL